MVVAVEPAVYAAESTVSIFAKDSIEDAYADPDTLSRLLNIFPLAPESLQQCGAMRSLVI